MDKFYTHFGPFEIFSSIISTLPVLMAGLIWYFPLITLSQLNTVFTQYSNPLLILISILAMYLLGVLISAITWPIFKTCNKIFSFLLTQDAWSMEKGLLIHLNNSDSQISDGGRLSLTLEERLAYMLNRRIGESKAAWVTSRVLPYLRRKDPESAHLATSYIALHIMFRNLWFNFLILAGVLIRSAILNTTATNIFNSHTFFLIITLLLSIIAFRRAIRFRNWWCREILFGFYHVELEEFFQNNQQKAQDSQ